MQIQFDPLAGSYYLEWLTNKMEEEAEKYFERIEAMGGVIPAIKDNFFQKEIAQILTNPNKKLIVKLGSLSELMNLLLPNPQKSIF